MVSKSKLAELVVGRLDALNSGIEKEKEHLELLKSLLQFAAGETKKAWHAVNNVTNLVSKNAAAENADPSLKENKDWLAIVLAIQKTLAEAQEKHRGWEQNYKNLLEKCNKHTTIMREYEEERKEVMELHIKLSVDLSQTSVGKPVSAEELAEAKEIFFRNQLPSLGLLK